jgi:hypothetical protein
MVAAGEQERAALTSSEPSPSGDNQLCCGGVALILNILNSTSASDKPVQQPSAVWAVARESAMAAIKLMKSIMMLTRYAGLV